MRKLVRMAALFAATTVLLAGCGGDDKTDEGGNTPPPTADAPTIVLQNGDIDKPQEITKDMSVKVDVAAPGSVQNFEIEIVSPCLTEQVLGGLDLSTKMNLVTPASDKMAAALATMGFPVKADAKGAKELSIDISKFVPMIALIYDKTSDHKFVLTVTDGANQKVTKTLWFHLTGLTSAEYNGDADLWANTGSLSLKIGTTAPSEVKLEYRVKGETTWNAAEVGTPDAEGIYAATIKPVWKESENENNVKVYTVDPKTGIFAKNTYEYQLTVDGEVEATGEFTPAKNGGDAIPNGDMSGWSKKKWIDSQLAEWPITFPNAEGQTFWDSGNNAFLEQYDEDGKPSIYTPLCSESEGTAHLKPQMVLGMVFASGNMYTGAFDYSGFNGTANFGQPYTWTARPRAMKLRYKATVGVIDNLGSNDPDADSYKDQPDRSCIFAAVVDWSKPHGVTSGMAAPTGMWNPAEGAALEEGLILGYGQQIITESTADWIELTIPLVWYDKDAANPSSSAFSLVISCATSLRGDYLTGCSTNEMYVDDFQWVY